MSVSSSVQVHLDKPRILKFDLDALQALESALNGQPLADTVFNLKRISTNTLILALWAGLQADDKTLTPGLAKKIVRDCMARGMSYTDLSTPVAEALEKCGLFEIDEREPVGNAPTTESEN